jgi:hypothetical protein
MLLGVVLHCSLILGIAAFTLAFFVDLKKTWWRVSISVPHRYLISLNYFKLKNSNILKMSGFTLLHLAGADSNVMKTRAPNVASEIGKIAD